MQWEAPDLNRGAPKRTGQCRTSTGELQSGLGNAGPQPGSSKADWATPDLSRGPLSGLGSGGFQLPADMSQEMSEKSVRSYVRRNVRKECQKIGQKTCQKKMSEDMSEKNVRR